MSQYPDEEYRKHNPLAEGHDLNPTNLPLPNLNPKFLDVLLNPHSTSMRPLNPWGTVDGTCYGPDLDYYKSEV
jgi:hypothetical protein